MWDERKNLWKYYNAKKVLDSLYLFHEATKGYSIFKGYPGGGDLKVIRNAGVGGIK